MPPVWFFRFTTTLPMECSPRYLSHSTGTPYQFKSRRVIHITPLHSERFSGCDGMKWHEKWYDNGMIQNGMPCIAEIWSEMVWYAMILEWNGMTKYDLVWHDMEWRDLYVLTPSSGMVWNGLHWCVWRGMIWQDLYSNGMMWRDMVWNGMMWTDLYWFGEIKWDEMSWRKVERTWDEMRQAEMNWDEMRSDKGRRHGTAKETSEDWAVAKHEGLTHILYRHSLFCAL